MTDVVGLPTAVKVALEALLHENKLTSWKVAAEGRTTVVVLRMTGPGSAAITHPTTTDQRFRLKPPSQLRRDAKRAEEHYNRRREPNQQEQKASDTPFSPTPLFSPTPEKLPHRKEEERTYSKGHSRCKQSAIPVLSCHSSVNRAREFHEVDQQTERAAICESVSQPASDCRVTELCEPCDLKTNTVTDNCDVNTDMCMEDNTGTVVGGDGEEAETESAILQRAERAGFDFNSIRDELSQAMDRKVQERLRDNRRNRRLHKVVMDTRNNMQMLFCESDDLVLRYDVTKQRLTYWCIKMYKSMVPELEDYTVRCLRHWPPLGNEDFVKERERVTEYLTTLAAVIRLYLG